ncbi:hypothetical protein LZD49_31770 [Dyadobacter sp. CY261]|uniref:hypothetical protein n=1 Tax=Dyadobacter sp. CY261 TaxID=2907203 RepID=UPI001F45AC8C|nr:hypothetical protein [Dyadobacter sp. CY261]MCF0075106.1 hypothetical protein [Dyadobacter sp. CY261]
MSKKQLFIIATASLLGLILLIFYITGRRNIEENNALELSVSEEEILIADMHELDSLFMELENTDIKSRTNNAVQLNISWEKSLERFSAKHQGNPVSSQIAGLVLANYRSRIEMLQKVHSAKSAASTKAEKIKEAILVEQAKNDALKTDNILLKEALLKL